LRKALLTFVVSILPSVRVCQHGPHRTDFLEIWYCELFWKSVEKVKICLKWDKNIRQFAWRSKDVLLLPARNIHHKKCMCNLRCFMLPARNIHHKKCMCNLQCFYIAGSDMELNSSHKTYCCFSTAELLRERAIMLRYTFIAYLVSESIMNWLTSESLIPVRWKRRTNPVQFGTLEIHFVH